MWNKVKKSVCRMMFPCFNVLPIACICVSCLLSVSAVRAQTQSLKLYSVHTNERAEIVFRKNGRYVSGGLKRLNYFLRDWRRNEPAKLDPRLFDLLWQVYQLSGSHDYIHVISAYRSPQTNNMLRSRSANSGVAKNSQHTLGKAMDFYLPDVTLSSLRKIGLKQQVGGVGYYPGSGSPFVHMDLGHVRHWPRMNRQELMALFPDGKTMHIPSDGHPLARYDQAVAEYRMRGGRPAQVMVARADNSKSPRLPSPVLGTGQNSLALPQPKPQLQQQLPASNPQVEPDVMVAVLPQEYVPVPAVSPLRPAAGTGSEGQQNKDLSVMAYASEKLAMAAVPVPGIKPVFMQTETSQKPAETENQLLAVVKPAPVMRIPVPAERAPAQQNVPEGDEIAAAIRQDSVPAGYDNTMSRAPARYKDEVAALIAQQDNDFITLSDEDDDRQDMTVIPDADNQAAAGAVSPDLLAGEQNVVAAFPLTTPKTSKITVHKDKQGRQPAEYALSQDELKQVPDLVFALGLQKSEEKPGVAKLSGTAINFRSVARVADVY